MQAFQSAMLAGLPGITHGTASRFAQPLTFSGHPVRRVREARRRFCTSLGISPDHLTLGRQVHGARVRVVTESHRGAGSGDPATYLASTGGLLTQRPGIALGVFTADCVPVLLHDPVTGWIGALHVGWRGAVAGIVRAATHQLTQHGVDVRDVRVWLGPAICGRCFSFDSASQAKDLRRAFSGVAVRARAGGYTADLRAGIRQQFIRLGYRARSIDVSPTCTAENPALPSRRRDGPTHANTLSVITRNALPGDLRGATVAILGFGVQGGGESALRYALRSYAQEILVVDDQPLRTFTKARRAYRDVRVRWMCGSRAASAPARVDVVVKNPGVPLDHPYLKRARAAGAQVWTDIGIFRATHDNPIIAVTGTKGKTTVATWLAYVLRATHQRVELAGNVRRSPLDIVNLPPTTPVVLELSSFQLEALEQPLRARLAVVTNLYPDHLNRHVTMRAYAQVKSRIADGQSPQDALILPLDSAWARNYQGRSRARTLWTDAKPNRRAQAMVRGGWIVVRGKRLVETRTLLLQDAASLRNAVTVALAAIELGVPRKHVVARLRSFRGVPERFETIREFRTRRFINDTTATNPVATAVGLQSVRKAFVLIAGGADKGLPLTPLVQQARRARAVILLPGTATPRLARALRGHPVVRVGSMRAAVQRAWGASQPGDAIILSPGAASFGLFTNEFDRGAQFTAAVRAL